MTDRETIVAVVGAKPWYQSKTTWHGILTLFIAIGSFLGADPLLAPFARYILVGNGVLIIVLRWLTHQPMAFTESKP